VNAVDVSKSGRLASPKNDGYRLLLKPDRSRIYGERYLLQQTPEKALAWLGKYKQELQNH
jgi:hypothetical protein